MTKKIITLQQGQTALWEGNVFRFLLSIGMDTS